VTDEILPGQGDVVAGRTLVRRVGVGAMGIVFEARTRTGQTTALKILKPDRARNPETLREFETEGEATGAVTHENVVRILDRGVDGGLHFIEMEFVDGPPLHEVLEKRGRLPWRDATRIVIQVAQALSAAHGSGLLHRDVKPQNILLYRDGRARLTDFGIVKDISSLKGYLLPGRQVGSATYASPEQCLAKRLDAMTDMYSLGATFYHMVCGRPPFKGETPNEVMNKHVKARVVPPSSVVEEIPKPLSNLIEKMLAKKQTERPQDMGRLAAELTMILEGKVAIAPDGPKVDLTQVSDLHRTRRATAEPRERSRLPAELVVTIVLLAAVLVLVVLMLSR
jgi:serine/threonine-protein kinase